MEVPLEKFNRHPQLDSLLPQPARTHSASPLSLRGSQSSDLRGDSPQQQPFLTSHCTRESSNPPSEARPCGIRPSCLSSLLLLPSCPSRSVPTTVASPECPQQAPHRSFAPAGHTSFCSPLPTFPNSSFRSELNGHLSQGKYLQPHLASSGAHLFCVQ